MKAFCLGLFFVASVLKFGLSGSATTSDYEKNFKGDFNSTLLSSASVNSSGLSTVAEAVEGVTIEHQQSALLKPGYSFRRISTSSLGVWKMMRDAAIQTGTLTCTRPRKGVCTAEFSGDRAKCSSGCYFVASRGGALAQ